jgi:hypothetical protein
MVFVTNRIKNKLNIEETKEKTKLFPHHKNKYRNKFQSSFYSMFFVLICKYDGAHKCSHDLVALPFNEDASRPQDTNLYFTWEDLIKNYTTNYRWRYIVTCPSMIIDLAKGMHRYDGIYHCCVWHGYFLEVIWWILLWVLHSMPLYIHEELDRLFIILSWECQIMNTSIRSFDSIEQCSFLNFESSSSWN